MDPSEKALKAAKRLVAYIEYFRAHGTGDLMRRYPDDEVMGGYSNIVRRAHELAAACEEFDGRSERRDRAALAAVKSGYVEIDPDQMILAAFKARASGAAA